MFIGTTVQVTPIPLVATVLPNPVAPPCAPTCVKIIVAVVTFSALAGTFLNDTIPILAPLPAEDTAGIEYVNTVCACTSHSNTIFPLASV